MTRADDEGHHPTEVTRLDGSGRDPVLPARASAVLLDRILPAEVHYSYVAAETDPDLATR